MIILFRKKDNSQKKKLYIFKITICHFYLLKLIRLSSIFVLINAMVEKSHCQSKSYRGPMVAPNKKRWKFIELKFYNMTIIVIHNVKINNDPIFLTIYLLSQQFLFYFFTLDIFYTIYMGISWLVDFSTTFSVTS